MVSHLGGKSLPEPFAPSEDSLMNSFRPDWSERWTAEQAERQLHKFKFRGPGWYEQGRDTLLVLPCDRDTTIPEEFWSQTWTTGERFEFNAYSGRSPAPAFNLIVNGPHRS